jgi:hypothetical protein
MTPTGSALARQFRGALAGLRDIITKLPDDQWYVGATKDQVPARRAHHAIMHAGRWCYPKGGSGYRLHPVARGDTPEAAYRCREDMLAYLDDVACQVEAALGGTTDEQFAGLATGGRTLLEHWVYALRHTQHHVGQLSSTLRERRLPPMKWH